MKSKILKVIVLLFLIILFGIIFSNQSYAVELEVQTTERAVTVGKEFYIRVKIKYNNNAIIKWYGDNNEEYIDALGGGEKEDGVSKTISNKDGVWIVDIGFKAKKIGVSNIKIVVDDKGGFLGIGNGSEEKKITITILPDMETAYKEEPSENANAQAIKYFILSDKQYNNSNNIKNISANNLNKIKKWKETVDKLISSDRHYEAENQYGAIQSVLNDIISAVETGNSVEETIQDNSNSLDSAYDLTKESINRIIIASVEGINRTENPFNDIFDDISYYEPTDEDVSTEVTDKVSIVLTVITNIGMIIAVLMSAILGLKYMLGSVEERADYKKGMIPYFVGAILLFGICTIVKVMQQIGQTINKVSF